MADALMTEVARNLRHTLLGVLRTFTSPLDGGPGELFCQWADDVYHPDTPAFAVAFGSDERAALAAFDAVFRRASASFPVMMPPVEAYMSSAAGAELASTACITLQALGEAADAEPGAAADGGA